MERLPLPKGARERQAAAVAWEIICDAAHRGERLSDSACGSIQPTGLLRYFGELKHRLDCHGAARLAFDAVARHRAIPMVLLVEDDDPSVHFVLAIKSSTPRDILAVLAEDLDAEVAEVTLQRFYAEDEARKEDI